MTVFKCSLDEQCKILLNVDSDNDIKLTVEDEVSYISLYLDKKTAQKFANKLNELLMEGYGNE